MTVLENDGRPTGNDGTEVFPTINCIFKVSAILFQLRIKIKVGA